MLLPFLMFVVIIIYIIFCCCWLFHLLVTATLELCLSRTARLFPTHIHTQRIWNSYILLVCGGLAVCECKHTCTNTHTSAYLLTNYITFRTRSTTIKHFTYLKCTTTNNSRARALSVQQLKDNQVERQVDNMRQRYMAHGIRHGFLAQHKATSAGYLLGWLVGWLAGLARLGYLHSPWLQWSPARFTSCLPYNAADWRACLPVANNNRMQS